MSDIDLDFLDSLDRWKLMQPTPGGSSGNGLCFLGESVVVLKQRGLFESLTYREQIAHYLATALVHCEVTPGLWRRHPTDFLEDQNAVDDHYGIAAACIALGMPQPAIEFLGHGRTHYFHWRLFRFRYYYAHIPIVNAVGVDHIFRDDDPRAWYGRQPGIVGLFEIAAYGKTSFWRLWLLALAVATTGLFGPKAHEDGGQDAWRLSFLVAESIRGRGFLCDLAVKLFESNLYKTWGPRGMRAVYERYFGHEHFLSRWARPISEERRNEINGQESS